MRSVILGGAGVFVVACSTSEPATFQYANCFVGCEISTPMMLGDEEDVVVTGSFPDKVSVESAAPSIVSVKWASWTCCPVAQPCRMEPLDGITVPLKDACRSNETARLDVDVSAQAEGSSELRVKKADGSIWGSVTLSVEKAASFQLACNTQGAVTLAQGDACPVTWRATDANGAGLMSTEGIFLTSSDANVVAFEPFIGAEDFTQATPTPSGAVSIDARGPGDATVTALGPGVLGGNATETLTVHVTP